MAAAYFSRHYKKIDQNCGQFKKKHYICKKLGIMAVDLKQQLDRVSVKAQIITGRYLSLRKQLDEANAEIDRLSATIGRMQTEIEKLKLANEYLRLVKSIADDPAEVRKAKAIITRLVREIDRCILDLND